MEGKSQVFVFLKNVIIEQGNEKEREWVVEQEEKLCTNFELRAFFIVFSSASRFIRKAKIQLSQKQLVEANIIYKGFQPEYWNLLEYVRSYLLLMLPEEVERSYLSNLTGLLETADIDEQVTLYKALPLYSYPKKLVKHCADGIRTNITDVFDAIALNNPYPANFLDKSAWNQMVLKAVFMKRPLYRIYGADGRANAELARMLLDFAHERWAANRGVSPELWRFVGPFMDENDIVDIQKVINGETLEMQAGVLVCSMSEVQELKDLSNQFSEIKNEIKNDRLNWTIIGRKTRSNLLN